MKLSFSFASRLNIDLTDFEAKLNYGIALLNNKEVIIQFNGEFTYYWKKVAQSLVKFNFYKARKILHLLYSHDLTIVLKCSKSVAFKLLIKFEIA